MGARSIDMRGQRFGRLTCVEVAKGTNHGAEWRCKCDCGGETTARRWNLLEGLTKSCGCLKRGVKFAEAP